MSQYFNAPLMRGRKNVLDVARRLVLLLLVLFAVITGSALAQTETRTPAKPRYFGPKRILLIPATRLGGSDKPLALELEAMLAESLRRIYCAPLYRSTVKKESDGALPETRKIDPKTGVAPEPTPAEVTEALVRAGEKAEVETVILALVQEATPRQMTVAFWNVDVRTAKASVEGRTMRRSLRDYPETESHSDVSNGDVPGTTVSSSHFSTTFTVFASDAADYKRLLRRMLAEWGTSGVR